MNAPINATTTGLQCNQNRLYRFHPRAQPSVASLQNTRNASMVHCTWWSFASESFAEKNASADSRTRFESRESILLRVRSTFEKTIVWDVCRHPRARILDIWTLLVSRFSKWLFIFISRWWYKCKHYTSIFLIFIYIFRFNMCYNLCLIGIFSPKSLA